MKLLLLLGRSSNMAPGVFWVALLAAGVLAVGREMNDNIFPACTDPTLCDEPEVSHHLAAASWSCLIVKGCQVGRD